jgi:hypothetical protein
MPAESAVGMSMETGAARIWVEGVGKEEVLFRLVIVSTGRVNNTICALGRTRQVPPETSATAPCALLREPVQQVDVERA